MFSVFKLRSSVIDFRDSLLSSTELFGSKTPITGAASMARAVSVASDLCDIFNVSFFRFLNQPMHDSRYVMYCQMPLGKALETGYNCLSYREDGVAQLVRAGDS